MILYGFLNFLIFSDESLIQKVKDELKKLI